VRVEARSMWIGAGNVFDQIVRSCVRLIDQAAAGDRQSVLLVLIILGLTLAILIRMMHVKGMP
jgi:hypothetical protein